MLNGLKPTRTGKKDVWVIHASSPCGLPKREPREGGGHHEGVTLALPEAHVHQNTHKCLFKCNFPGPIKIYWI